MEYQRLKTSGKNAPNRGANPYVDNYTGFTWNNIHSSAYNCFIENTGHLSFVGAPDFSNNFISPAFQTRTYYTGTQNNSKKFNLNLVFYQLTLQELNTALHWLDRTIVSDFFFDYDPYWKYSCKLSSLGTIEKYVTGRSMYRGRPCDLYLCRMAVTFETVYHPEAISAYAACNGSLKVAPNEDNFVTYFDLAGQYMPFMTQNENNDWIKVELITPTPIPPNGSPEIINHVWSLKLNNYASHSTFFKIHFYNVQKGFSIYKDEGQAINVTTQFGPTAFEAQDIDAANNLILIAHTMLRLDDNDRLNLHYNSEDGTVLCANQLVEQMRGINSSVICAQKVATPNILIPGAMTPEEPGSLQLRIVLYDNYAQFLIEYDTYEYTV